MIVLPVRATTYARKHIRGRHEHARRTDAALRRVMPMKGRLQRPAYGKLGQTLDGDDRPAIRLLCRDHARAYLRAIHQHRARTAVAGIAANLGARQAEPAPHNVG